MGREKIHYVSSFILFIEQYSHLICQKKDLQKDQQRSSLTDSQLSHQRHFNARRSRDCPFCLHEVLRETYPSRVSLVAWKRIETVDWRECRYRTIWHSWCSRATWWTTWKKIQPFALSQSEEVREYSTRSRPFEWESSMNSSQLARASSTKKRTWHSLTLGTAIHYYNQLRIRLLVGWCLMMKNLKLKQSPLSRSTNIHERGKAKR